MMYQVDLTFESVDDILSMNASGSDVAVLCRGAVYYAVQGCSTVCICWLNPQVYFAMGLFIMLYMVVLTFKGVDDQRFLWANPWIPAKC